MTTPTTSRRPHPKPHTSAAKPKAPHSEKKEVKAFSRTEKPKEEKKFTIAKTYKPRVIKKSPQKQKFRRKCFSNTSAKIDPLKPRKKQTEFVPSNEDPGDGRVQCNCCGRWFMPDRIEKHEDACYKVIQFYEFAYF